MFNLKVYKPIAKRLYLIINILNINSIHNVKKLKYRALREVNKNVIS